MRTKYKQWAVDYLKDHLDIVLDKIDYNDPFFKEIEIEIGSGKGDFILSLASRNPNTNYLAIEKVKTVAGMMAKKVVESELNNVRVIAEDVEVLLGQLKENSVNKIYLNFSDPWPKKRHEKRRLTHINFLNKYYHVLKEGSFVVIKTDNDSLYEYTLEVIPTSKFTLMKNEIDYIFEEDDAMSEYEAKFRAKGNKIHRIILKKEGK